MTAIPDPLRAEIDALPTKSAKVRALGARGYPRAEIARYLGLRYQHVRNVLEDERRRALGPAADAPTPRAEERLVTLALDAQGRLALPPELLAGIEMGEDGKVTARIVDGELLLVTPRVALRKLRALARAATPDGVTVVDDFIAEKRREAERD